MPVIVGNRLAVDRPTWHQDRQPVRTVIRRCSTTPSQTIIVTATSRPLPTLYVLNAASVAKQHSIQHLSADLVSYDVHIAVITATHLKQRHADHFAAITCYPLSRRDCAGHNGGGVAVFVNSQMSATAWTCPSESLLLELLSDRPCVCAGARDDIVPVLYHPPQPLSQTSELLNHIEVCVDAVASAFPTALVELAGDFNTLPEDDVVARLHLCLGRDIDRQKRLQSSHRVHTIATQDNQHDQDTTDVQATFALFLSHLSSLDITFDTSNDVQTT